MNIAILPAQRREIIAGSKSLCEGGPGNMGGYFDASRFSVYDEADGRILVFVGKRSILSDLTVDFRVRSEAVRRGRHCLLRSRHGFGMSGTDPKKTWTMVDAVLDAAVEQARELWADFPEEAVEYREWPE